MPDIKAFKFLRNNWSRPNQFLVSETVSVRGHFWAKSGSYAILAYDNRAKRPYPKTPTQRPFGKLLFSQRLFLTEIYFKFLII